MCKSISSDKKLTLNPEAMLPFFEKNKKQKAYLQTQLAVFVLPKNSSRGPRSRSVLFLFIYFFLIKSAPEARRPRRVITLGLRTTISAPHPISSAPR